MSARPSGRFALRDDGLYVLLDRLFRASIEDVWFSLTKPSAMQHWLGSYTGNPATGGIHFHLDGSTDPHGVYTSVLEWDPPHRLHIDIGEGDRATNRRLFCHLHEAGGMTTLTVGQRLHTPVEAAVVGPTLDFYLDRLSAYRDKAELPQWDRYFSPYSLYYRDLVVPPVTA